LVSWQALQPELMPVWIWAPVGAGSWNPVPGAVLLELAATSPVGADVKWQVSQVVDDGMCEFAPAGAVGGMTTILVTPAKLELLIVGPWQLAQLALMPAWFISDALKWAPSTTGVAAMLEPLPTWQLSHAAAVGMWVAGLPTTAKPIEGIAKPAAASP
jgi:hypothetical protein